MNVHLSSILIGACFMCLTLIGKAQSAGELVKSIEVAGNPYSNVTSVTFKVTFKQVVTGVDVYDFVLDASQQVTSAVIDSISGAGSEYLVFTSGIPKYADGYLGLILKSTGTNIQTVNGIKDNAGFVRGDHHLVGAAFDISRTQAIGRNSKFFAMNFNAALKLLKFSDDGSKMFVMSNKTKILMEFHLEQPFDISTSVFAGESEQFFLGAHEDKPQQYRFGDEGKRMYVIGATYNTLFSYTLNEAFDISTAKYDGIERSLRMPKKDSKMGHFNFNAVGTEMYAWRKSTDSIFVASLSVPFEVATAEFTSAGAMTDLKLDRSYKKFVFSSDGKKAFSTRAKKTMHEYGLSKPYDLTTAVYRGIEENLEFESLEALAVTNYNMNNDGTKMYILVSDIDVDGVYEIPLNAQPLEINDFKLDINFTRNGNDSLVYVDEKDARGLQHDENNIRFSYTSNSSQAKDKVLFRVFLEGEDDSWSSWRSELKSSYNSLSYGAYTINVEAKNIHGQRSELHSLSFRINPPWYLTIWAFLLYITLLSALIWLIVKINSAKLAKRNQMLEKEVQERTEEISEKMEETELAKTEIEKQAIKLREMDKVKTRFFANISHELRTPLTLINAPLEALMDNGDYKDDEVLNETIGVARRNGGRLKSLIDEILDLTKLEAGKLKLIENPVNLKELIELSLERYELGFRAKSIDFKLDFQLQEDFTTNLDGSQASKVINNLLSNALKFTPEEGKVSIDVRSKPNDKSLVQIIVKDTGEGIHPDDLPFVFNRFYQSELADKKAEGGTGIGLSLAYELAKLFGGDLHAESKLGKGSKFIFELPKREVDPGLVAPMAVIMDKDLLSSLSETIKNYSQKFDIEKPCLLITEDHPEMRAFIAKTLSPFFTIHQAENGRIGLSVLKEQSIDIVITDVMMPVMDGFELLEAIKADEALHQISIIMLTARADHESRLQALTLGIDDYLTKPFSNAEFLARIKNILENRIKIIREFKALSNPEENQKLEEFILMHDLSERELDILKLMAQRYSNQEIGTRLELSVNTVKYHLKKLYFKLDITTRQAMADKAEEVIL